MRTGQESPHFLVEDAFTLRRSLSIRHSYGKFALEASLSTPRFFFMHPLCCSFGRFNVVSTSLGDGSSFDEFFSSRNVFLLILHLRVPRTISHRLLFLPVFLNLCVLNRCSL